MSDTNIKKYGRVTIDKIERTIEKGMLQSDEAKLLYMLFDDLVAKKSVSVKRLETIARSIIYQKECGLPHLATCDTQECINAWSAYYDSSTHKIGVKKTTLVAFRQVMTFLVKKKYNTAVDMDELKEIKVTVPQVMKNEDDILTPDELQRFFNNCRAIRDRIFYEVLYESGGRVTEVRTLKWSQITFTDTHAFIKIQSKTDKIRKVPLMTSHILLRRWKDEYPSGWAPEKFVFPNNQDPHKAVGYDSIKNGLKRILKRAGIEKNITPHSFRHTRITDLSRDGIPQQHINMMVWGSPSSQMVNTYTHLSGDDVEESLLAGIETKTSRPKKQKAIQCPSLDCALINPTTAIYCLCGHPLHGSAPTQEQVRLTVQEIEQHPDFKRIIEAALLSLKMNKGEV